MSSKKNNWDNEFTTRELSLKEIQEEELKILISFDSFCKRYHLTYSLAGGTLLGAIRHKGFIPWDDDIDISLSRAEYKKLLRLRETFESETGLKFYSHLLQDLSVAPFFKIINPNIIVYSSVDCVKENFLWIDVTPVDSVPESKAEREKLFFLMKFFRFILSVYTVRFNASKKRLNNLLRTICKPLLLFPGLKKFICRKMTQYASKCTYGSTPLVGAVTWGIYGTKEVIPYSGYRKSDQVLFEGYLFPAMACWDTYLSQLYGDYRQIPKLSNRKSHKITCRFMNVPKDAEEIKTSEDLSSE